MSEEPEDAAQSWLDIATRHRQHVKKYPNCMDRDERLRRAEMYERFAAEERAESKDAKSAVLMSPEGNK